MFNREQHFGYEKNSNRRKILRKAANNSPLLNKTGEKMGCIRRTIPLRRTKEKHFFSFEFMLQKTLTQKILILKHPLSQYFLSVCCVRIGFGRVHPKVFQVSLRKCFLCFHRMILLKRSSNQF